MQAKSFIPPQRTLMGPGPSDVPARILGAMARPTVGHLDPTFVGMMDSLKLLLRYAYRTENDLTFAVSAPGSAGMEACVVNLVEPGDKVIVCQNGVFGGRMRENVERAGGTAVMVEDAWGSPVDPQKLEDALKGNPDAKVVGFVHAETSTGARSDAQTLAQIAQRHDCLTIVDTVTSLAGSELQVDTWGLDAVYSGSQKCLSCTPGLSPVTFSDRAVAAIRGRQSKVQSWFLDLELVMGYWGKSGGGGGRAYHHTAPVNALYGLHEALVILTEEGIDNAWKRHLHHHQGLAAGLSALGMEFLVDADHRLPQLNAVKVPDGIDEADVRKRLLAEFSIEIGAGLGALKGKVWRIGLMGASARQDNVLRLLAALDSLLPGGGGAAAARAFYDAR